MIINFKKFINENKDYLNRLTNLVEEFRSKEEIYNDWEFNKECFKGTCQDITKYLVKFLEEHGYNAERIQGYYLNVSDDFIPDTSEWDWKDKEDYINNGHDNKWSHWWVLVDNTYIVDITSDQFHPGEENEYRVIITDKNDNNYTTKHIK